MKTLSIFLTLSCICLSINAEIYSYVDANGNTIYTDNPPKGQQTRLVDIELTPSRAKTNQNETIENTTAAFNNAQPTVNDEMKTIKLSPPGFSNTANIEDNFHTTDHSNASLTSNNKPQTIYSELQIIAPSPQAVINNSGGQMMVQVKSDPALTKGDKYRLLVDKQVMGESASPALSLNNLKIREHNLQDIIVNDQGKIVTESAEIVFYVKQITLADRRRIKPCELADYGVRPECPLAEKPPPESLLRKTATVVKNIINTAIDTAAQSAVNSVIP